MARKNNNINVLTCLGSYYEQLQDYESMLIHYNMAIDKYNNTNALTCLGSYYKNIN